MSYATTDVRLETFFEILRRFETTLNRIENLASTQKEQSEEIKGRVESIEKSHALTEEAIARASTREQTLLDEMKTEVATVARKQASIKSEIYVASQDFRVTYRESKIRLHPNKTCYTVQLQMSNVQPHL